MDFFVAVETNGVDVMKLMSAICLGAMLCSGELFAAEPSKPYSLPDDPSGQYTSVPHVLVDGRVEWIDYMSTPDVRGLYCQDDADFMRCHVMVKGLALEQDFKLPPVSAKSGPAP
jgi:hypothetical protein